MGHLVRQVYLGAKAEFVGFGTALPPEKPCSWRFYRLWIKQKKQRFLTQLSASPYFCADIIEKKGCFFLTWEKICVKINNGYDKIAQGT